MTMTLYLVRHAEPLIKDGRKHSLTKKGRGQADKLANALVRELKDSSDISILHSPVIRCRETAQIIGDGLGLPIKEAPLRLRRTDNLTLQGAQSKMSQYLANFEKLDIEPPDAFTERILDYVQKQQSDVLVIVGNEVPLRLLLQRIAKTGYTVTIKHGDCIKVAMTDGVFSVIGKI